MRPMFKKCLIVYQIDDRPDKLFNVIRWMYLDEQAIKEFQDEYKDSPRTILNIIPLEED